MTSTSFKLSNNLCCALGQTCFVCSRTHMQLSSQFCDWKKQLSQVESANKLLEQDNIATFGQFNLAMIANLQTQTQEGQKPSFYIYDERTGRKRRHDPWFALHPHKKPSLEDPSKSSTNANMKRVPFSSDTTAVTAVPKPKKSSSTRLKTKNAYKKGYSKNNTNNILNNSNNNPSSPEQHVQSPQAVSPEVGATSAMSPCNSQQHSPEQPDMMELNLHTEASQVTQITEHLEKMSDADFSHLLTFDFFDTHEQFQPELAEALLSAMQEQQPVQSQDDCMPHLAIPQNHSEEHLAHDHLWIKAVEEILRPAGNS